MIDKPMETFISIIRGKVWINDGHECVIIPISEWPAVRDEIDAMIAAPKTPEGPDTMTSQTDETVAQAIIHVSTTETHDEITWGAAIDMARAAIDAFCAHNEARSMALVPKEPSEDMLEAGNAAVRGLFEPPACLDLNQVYAAMIAEGGKQ